MESGSPYTAPPTDPSPPRPRRPFVTMKREQMRRLTPIRIIRTPGMYPSGSPSSTRGIPIPSPVAMEIVPPIFKP